MQESKSLRKRRLNDRERRRIETIEKRHGKDFFHRNSKKAGKLSPTKFNSETGSAAATKRWADHRERKELGNGSENS